MLKKIDRIEMVALMKTILIKKSILLKAKFKTFKDENNSEFFN